MLIFFGKLFEMQTENACVCSYVCADIYDTKHTYIHTIHNICIVCLYLFIDTIERERENHLNFKHVHIRTERIHTQLLRLLQKSTKQKLKLKLMQKHTSFKHHDDHLWFHQQAERLLFCEFLIVLFIIITSSFHQPI